MTSSQGVGGLQGYGQDCLQILCFLFQNYTNLVSRRSEETLNTGFQVRTDLSKYSVSHSYYVCYYILYITICYYILYIIYVTIYYILYMLPFGQEILVAVLVEVLPRCLSYSQVFYNILIVLSRYFWQEFITSFCAVLKKV